MNIGSVRKLRRLRALLFGAGVSTAGVSGVFAQATPSASDTNTNATSDDVVKMSAFAVTGSNIPSAGEMPPAPVLVLGQQEIERTGVRSDLLQVIRKSAPQFSGNVNLGSSNGNIASISTNGGSQLSLRNAATLVLVNGRRLAAAPVAATGGNVFVDVNSIPIAAIDRIEILTDGASAIYGTDAVSGVVNIILKPDFRGGEITGRYGQTDNEGHYRERSVSGVFGGSSSKTGTSITGSFEWVKTDPIYNFERPFSRPSFGTTNFAGVIQTGTFNGSSFTGNNNGYYYLDPSLNSPKPGSTLQARGYSGPYTSAQIQRFFDLSNGVTMILGNQKKIATLAVDQKITPNISAFGDFIYARTETLSTLNAQPLTIQLPASDPRNTLGQDVSVRNRFIERKREYRALDDSFRIVAGLKGKFSDQWSWEGAVNSSQARQDFANANLVRTSARVAAVAAGRIDLFSRTQPAGALDGVFGQAHGVYHSTLESIDFKVVGTDLVQIPGGGVSLAFGGEARKEKLTAVSDVDSQSATFAYDSGTTIDPFNHSRRINSLFAEVKVPIVGKDNRLPGIYAADFTVAARHERYSDNENPTVPKFELSYLPFDDSLMFRATFSRSFAAPTLYNLNSPTGEGFSANIPEFDNNQAFQRSVAVTQLSPSRSRNYGFGVVWTPKQIKGLSISVDYFNLYQTAVISNLGATGVVDQVFHDVNEKGAASQYAKLIHVGSFDGPTISTPGQIRTLGLDNLYYIIPAASNLGAQLLRGYDIKLRYDLPLESYGKLSLDSTSTYYDTYNIQVAPGAPYTPTAGLVTNLNGTISRWRTYNTLTYKLNDFLAAIGHTYYPATADAVWTPASQADGYPAKIPAYSVWDAHVSYTFRGDKTWFRGLTLTVGENNIRNRLPPKSAAFDGLSNADVGEFSPIGRFTYVEGSYRF